MNTPSPLVPQGAQTEPRHSLMTKVFIILFLHVGVVALFLLQGCKNEETSKPLTDSAPPPPTLAPDTNPPPVVGGLLPGSGLPSTSIPPTPPPPGVPSGAIPAGNQALPTGGAGVSGSAPSPAGGITSLPPAPGGAAPAPTFDPAPTTPSTEHIVVKGDTGVTIAKKYNMGWKAIEAANAGVDARKLKVGQKLIIPAKSVAPAPSHGASEDAAGGSDSTYTVKSGDTLAKIGKSHGVSVKALQSANGLKTTAIAVGKKLKIPAKAAAPAAPAPAAAPVVDTIPALPVPSLPPPSLPTPGLPPAPKR